MEINGLTSEMGLFWDYVKMLLEGVSPWVMIMFSLISLSFFLPIVIKAFVGGSKNEDEDYDFRQY